MAAPRLPFLWPFLYRSAQSPTSRAVSSSYRRGVQSTAVAGQNVSGQRYGTANEPPPNLRPPPAGTSTKPSPRGVETSPTKSATRVKKGRAAQQVQDAAQAQEDRVQTGEKARERERDTETAKAAGKDALPSDTPLLADPTGGAPTVLSAVQDPSTESAAKPATPAASNSERSQATGAEFNPSTPPPPPPALPDRDPLGTVLSMPPPASESNKSNEAPSAGQGYYHENAPAEEQQGGHHPPHISTPRYVHHFDTYGLVQRLTQGKWTEPQAVTLMKAVRLILGDNIALAREGLVSKSNVENETYLFRAACSELRTEVGMRRKAEVDGSRTERGALSHEVEILSQRVGMETAGLKEELRGMVEGRKMAVREEGRGTDGKIQELNYRITVALNSDAKSDVEGVRWLITRRAIVALFVCVSMVLGSLKYASSVMQAEEDARKRRDAAMRAQLSDSHQSAGGGGGNTGAVQDRSAGPGDGGGVDTHRDFGAQLEAEKALRDELFKKGENPSFVSLG